MPHVHVRNIDSVIYDKLKLRAQKNQRTLEAELRLVLQQAVEEPVTDIKSEIAKVRAMFAGRQFSDSAELLRDDRER